MYLFSSSAVVHGASPSGLVPASGAHTVHSLGQPQGNQAGLSPFCCPQPAASLAWGCPFLWSHGTSAAASRELLLGRWPSGACCPHGFGVKYSSAGQRPQRLAPALPCIRSSHVGADGRPPLFPLPRPHQVSASLQAPLIPFGPFVLPKAAQTSPCFSSSPQWVESLLLPCDLLPLPSAKLWPLRWSRRAISHCRP